MYYFNYIADNISGRKYFSHKTKTGSEDSEKMTTGEKTIQTSSRTDRSGHSVLQTLGQAQGGGDDGGGVGYEEFSLSMEYGRVLIEYDLL